MQIVYQGIELSLVIVKGPIVCEYMYVYYLVSCDYICQGIYAL
jgi:hypothetical protein